MKSLRSKMTVIAIVPVIVGAVLISIIGFWSISQMMTTYSEEVLLSVAKEQRSSMDRVFENIEHSAHIMQKFTQMEISSVEQLQNPETLERFNEHAEEMIVNLSANTEYADSLYIRFNPEYTDGSKGVFYVRNTNGNWEKAPLTDLSHYREEDKEQLLWWLVPVEKKEPVWVMPHMDNVLLDDTLSYCIPVYNDEQLICVIGVDTRVRVLASFMKEIDIYETSSSFLTDADGYIIYHPEENDPKVQYRIERDSAQIASVLNGNTNPERMVVYTNPDQEKIALADSELPCGLRLVVSVRQNEVYAGRQKLIEQMGLVMLLIVMILVVAVQVFVSRLVEPIHNLIQASERISKGDIDSVHLEDASRDDEIGSLNDSLKGTIAYLRKYINRVNALAYSDLMTGVRNRTSYLENITKINEGISAGQDKFSVAVFDVNNLKTVNDTLGHEFGDCAIRQTSQLICSIFKESPVYRTGGDEFVVILDGKDYQNGEKLIREFQNRIQKGVYLGKGYNLVVACGISECNQDDIRFDDVFNRADKAMYENKKAIKTAKEDL